MCVFLIQNLKKWNKSWRFTKLYFIFPFRKYTFTIRRMQENFYLFVRVPQILRLLHTTQLEHCDVRLRRWLVLQWNFCSRKRRQKQSSPQSLSCRLLEFTFYWTSFPSMFRVECNLYLFLDSATEVIIKMECFAV